jgi:hypothetical protein
MSVGRLVGMYDKQNRSHLEKNDDIMHYTTVMILKTLERRTTAGKQKVEYEEQGRKHEKISRHELEMGKKRVCVHGTCNFLILVQIIYS